MRHILINVTGDVCIVVPTIIDRPEGYIFNGSKLFSEVLQWEGDNEWKDHWTEVGLQIYVKNTDEPQARQWSGW